MRKPVYIAAYHQSKFGKLMGMTVPDIIRNAVEGVCKEANAPPSLSPLPSHINDHVVP